MTALFTPKPLGPLASGMGGGALFEDWLGRGFAFADPASPWGETAAPLFSPGWIEGHLRTGAEILPAGQLGRLEGNLRRLAAGGCGVVVTGQQPGYLGGPLYTLYKIATAVVLARNLSRPDRPVLPVFWSGDDDTDLPEALSAVGWDPGPGAFLQSEGRALTRSAAYRRRMVGSLECRLFSGRSAAWLTTAGEATGDGLTADLAALWGRAVAQDWRWAPLARAAWTACFADSDLVVLSGDDQGLHEAAAGFSAECRGRGPQLVELARRQGRLLEQKNLVAQLGERSLRRPWYRTEDGRRLPLADPFTAEAPSGSLRPGVLMRSLIQDWLLRPDAVVVGPSEYSYLQQLEPLYRECGVVRAPLVPRLAGWLLPAGFDAASLAGLQERFLPPAVLAGPAARDLAADASASLAGVLRQMVGLDPERAQALAERRAARWRRGVQSLLEGQIREFGRLGNLPGPPWIYPLGQRQERRLAGFGALGLWGGPLREAVLLAAALHLEAGRRRSWSEFRIDVPVPAFGTGRKP